MATPTRVSRLAVSLLAEPVGELRHASQKHDATPYRFTYEAGLPDRLSVALNMPTSERDYATPDIPAPFEQSLPEMNLSIFPTAIWKFVVRDRIGLLWASSRRRIGRVRFNEAELEARQKQPPSVTLSTSELKTVKDGESLFMDTVKALRDIPGVSGIQPKVLITVGEPKPAKAKQRRRAKTDHDDRGGYADHHPPARTLNTDTHILKANHPDYLGATVVESLCLDAAEKAGLPVPERLLSGDGRLLAVKRFDLKDDRDPFGFDEVGALLGRTAEHKYSGSLEEVAQIVREFSSAQHRIDSLHRLFKLCVLNNVVRNGDAHLKNFGLVYDTPEDARLSPVYDVLTTRCFERLRNDAPALTLSQRQQWDDYDSLLAFGKTHCQMGRAEMRQSMATVAAAIEAILPRIQDCREQYPYAASTLWIMRAEWLKAQESLRQHIKGNR